MKKLEDRDGEGEFELVVNGGDERVDGDASGAVLQLMDGDARHSNKPTNNVRNTLRIIISSMAYTCRQDIFVSRGAQKQCLSNGLQARANTMTPNTSNYAYDCIRLHRQNTIARTRTQSPARHSQSFAIANNGGAMIVHTRSLAYDCIRLQIPCVDSSRFYAIVRNHQQGVCNRQQGACNRVQRL